MKEHGLFGNFWSKVIIGATCGTLLLSHGSALDKQSPEGVSVQYHEQAEGPHDPSPSISMWIAGATGNDFSTGVTLPSQGV
jgi:hypothetical protein